jgi:lipopolysaccharide/colanic/teichoic acid biosynthesis glycosyltransferase
LQRVRTAVRTSVRIAKRALDVVAASIGLAVTATLYPIIAAAIYLESPGQVLFRQRRAGRLLGRDSEGSHRFRFQEFEIIKFRTMKPNAEAATGVVVAAEHDDRITRVGRFLRRTRLDELPQFWNVLRGDMSLVGPRPERPELIADLALAIPFFEERMRGVRPGLTGLAQVSLGYTGRPPPGSKIQVHIEALTNPFKVEEAEGALADDMRIKALYDFAYVASTEDFFAFLRMETWILLQTPLAVLKRTGR